jgi:hypothetical protein
VIFLSGHWSSWVESQFEGYAAGPFPTPNIWGSLRYLDIAHNRPWGADNGCYSQGDRFVLEDYLAWLAAIPEQHKSRCLFATAPDVVGDWQATLARSFGVLSDLRALGFGAALVLQEGLQLSDLDWDSLDTVFIGGDKVEFKWSPVVRSAVAEAKQRGKWVHMGKVNTRGRLRIAFDMGCDSVDGTFLAFGPRLNTPRLKRWLDELEFDSGQLELW